MTISNGWMSSEENTPEKYFEEAFNHYQVTINYI